MRRVAIIGGGITGLATAWFLRHGLEPRDGTDPATGAGPDDLDITLFEADDRLGGKVHTVPFADEQLDVGADAFLDVRPNASRLARRLGLGDDLVAPASGQVWLWIGDRLAPLPEGTMLGAPTDLPALLRSRVLSPAGLARAALEPLLPGRPLRHDVAVGTLVASRFGREVAETLVEPLLGGVYAGRADRLSVEATAAPIAAVAAEHRSLFLGMQRRRRSGPPAGPMFLTVRGGLSRITGTLAEGLDGVDVRTGTPVGALERDGRTWRVVPAEGEPVVADAVVVTVPAFAAADLLGPLSAAASRELTGIPYASVAVVTLAYPKHAVGHAGGSGMLVPPREGRLVKAATWSSAKWPHLADSEHFLVRASAGRIDDHRPQTMDDATLAEAVDAELREAMGLTATASDWRVTRWPRALPQYEVGHRARVARIREALASDAAGVHVAGAAYDGIGLAPCVAQAEDTVRVLTGNG